jgi:hypothetical protein
VGADLGVLVVGEPFLYSDRDVIKQGKIYTNHVLAITREGLHSKSDIAAELAHRDIEIARLSEALNKIVCEVKLCLSRFIQ